MTSPMTPGTDPWVVQPPERARYQQQFDSLKPINGVITGGQAKDFFLQSQLPPAVLGQIWGLSDTDSDGRMNINEFSIACKLINLKLRGFEVPSSLPPSLIRSLQAYAAVNQPLATPPTVPSIVSPPNVVSIPRPIAAPTVVPKIGGPPVVASMAMPIASQQSRQPVAANARPTSNTSPSKLPPARPPPTYITGAGFVPTTGPPPKPQPPSFPSSPVAAASPVKPIVPPMAPPVQMVQPMPTVVSNMDLFDLLMSEGAPPVASVAPIAPINTAPVPQTAFTMDQAMPPMSTMAPTMPATGAPAVPLMATGIAMVQHPGMPMVQAAVQPMVQPIVQTMIGVPSMISGVPPTVAGATTVSHVAGNGMVAGVTPVITPSVTSLPQSTMNGSIIHTPVSTSTPLSTTTRPPSIDRTGSVDSQHRGSIDMPQQHRASIDMQHRASIDMQQRGSISGTDMQQHRGSVDSQHSGTGIASPQEWAVPHQTKLKYTQLFNTWDRTRSGFLSGPQARNIMVQSQLPQAVLAQIWALADMDSDGRLGCEEFVLAMHLCDMAKAGEVISTSLPPDLIPPTFRRQRQSSVSSQGVPDNIDPLAGMPQTSFEDKRKENFDKGQAELDRRRKALMEVQRKEQEERERKEREEAEKREKQRLEQERRRQAELEQQMMRQKEMEEQKEEERRREQERKEAARKEMERQRQLEWETQKMQELQARRQQEQDSLLKLKAKNQTLTIELGTLNEKVKELSQKICDTRVGVSTVKSTIDGMRTTRDQQLQEMSALKNKLREQNQRLLACSQEKAKLEAKSKAQDAAGQEAHKLAVANKKLAIKQLEDKLEELKKEVAEKEQEVDNSNKSLDDLKEEMKVMVNNCKELLVKYEEKKKKILEMRNKQAKGGFTAATASWGDEAWSDSGNAEEIDVDSWPTDTAATVVASAAATATIVEDTGGKKYRALYEFVARNQDEISFQPGDIIIVPPVQNAEPGWMAGEIRGHTGWFPESYVEPIEPVEVEPVVADPFVHQDSLEKRTLEGIAEVPENLSDAGSAVGDGPHVEPATPKLGEGQLCNLKATTLYQYRPTTEGHLSFGKGETVTIKEQQDVWCYGQSSDQSVGWFPKSYVKIEVTNGQDTMTVSGDGLNEYYISLYQYDSSEAGDLNFNHGEIILVSKKENDWWTGVIGDRTGIFPSNYVEKYDMPNQSAAKQATPNDQKPEELSETAETAINIQEQPKQKTAEQLEEERAEAEDRDELPDFAAMSASQYTSKKRKPDIVQVIAPYKATSIEQLDLSKGQLIAVRRKHESGWWEGELQARGKKKQVGWFPASYVKLLQSSSNRSTPVSHRYQDSPTMDPFAEKVMALYPYKAQNEDELSFEKGDVIVVLSKDEDSWWRGELNGLSGVFPSNYVSPMLNALSRAENAMAQQLDSMERKRQEYIKELIVTEEAYIVDMQLVHEVFEKPLLASMVLTVNQVDKIFINWRDIIACNDSFLRTLRIRRDNSEAGVVRMIGDILCENIPRMSAYVRFCSCQISAAVYLQRLTETNPSFVEVAQRCQQDPRTKGMPLSSFLIKPMQRITKYPLIIGKILEYTRPDHPDRQYLQEALAKAEEFCTQVNEGVREKENSDRLEWLQTHVVCDGLEEQIIFNSLTNSLGPRKLVHFGILHKAKSGKELVGFLTNDFLLFAQPTKSMPSGQQFSFERNEHQKFKLYRRPIFLQALSLINEYETAGLMNGSFNGHDSNEQSRTLKLSDSKKAITLVAPSISECSLWVRRISEARRHFAETEKSRLLRQRSIRKRHPKGHLRIIIEEAEELVSKNKGKCNAFCKVSMGSQEEQTIVVSGTDCPVWDTSMQFQVKDLHEDTLCITIFDKGYFSPDEFLGRAEVRVVDIVRDSKDACGPITKRIKLREVDRGDVVLKLDLRLFGSR
ncbi:intersectin-1 isoform X2 [Phymastichus coffea]|uniref:intersectin-1 isoform X2 n=1 Tax=Phymastichus coffea TaxID=108790 RepID=UPI00273CE178|nr:intersectin-1 isoform X2 [Phymastichus coffea]